jgi:hypothetical protein
LFSPKSISLSCYARTSDCKSNIRFDAVVRHHLYQRREKSVEIVHREVRSEELQILKHIGAQLVDGEEYRLVRYIQLVIAVNVGFHVLRECD